MPTKKEQAIQAALQNAEAAVSGVSPSDEFTDEMFWGAFGEGGVLGSDEGSAETEAQEQTRAEKFSAVAGGLGIPTEGVTEEFLTRLLEQAGVDISLPNIAGFIEWYTYTSPDASDQEKQADLELVTSMVQVLASDPANRLQGAETPYSQALEMSGFDEGLRWNVEAGFLPPHGADVGAAPPMPVGPIQQPDTGWQMFKNGVLANLEDGSVYYKPGSTAAGSSWWYQSTVSSWSADKVATWRKRLADMGYLPKSAADTEGLDIAFEQALKEFHRQRYLHNGKAVAFDASAASNEPSMTAKDFQNQLRNNVREQFLAVFGDEPSDAELESWTRFTIRQANEIQQRLMARGVDEGTALTRGITEAGEMAKEQLWDDPIASYQRERTEENTSLQDALARTASAMEGLLG